jgi:hypothetical protein
MHISVTSINNEADQDTFEFSDPEMGLEKEPLRRSTRSVSKSKEKTLPPSEPVPRPHRVKRGPKNIDPKYEQRHRRRRIREEIIDSEEEQDTHQ